MENYFSSTDIEFEALKVPPHSIQAEQSLLGGLLLDNQTWDSIADKVMPEDFYRQDHRLIFQTIEKLAEKNEPFDIVTLSEILIANNQLEEVGGIDYLSVLVNDTPSAANIIAYAKIVRDRSILRQLIHIGTDISDSAFNTEGRETEEILEQAERDVFKIAEQQQRGQAGGFTSIKKLLATAVDKIETLYEQDGSITGESTGFNDFDDLTSGLQPSDLIIVAGRPSMGKTTIAMNMAENVAIRSSKPVAVFSMEMPGDALAMRMMSSLGRIDQTKVRTGKLSDDEWPRLTSAINLLAETKLFIDDTPALTPTEVRAKARRLTREHGQLGLIVLDYLQLMHSPSSGDNRVQQISDISRSLKALAKELNVPVIALSQLNRNLEQRPNKRPVMSDLRECVTAETQVMLANGSRPSIASLVGKHVELIALNQQGKFIKTYSDKIWKVGKKQVFKISLSSGREIRASAEHRFLADSNWVKVKDLNPGDELTLGKNFIVQLSDEKYPAGWLSLLTHFFRATHIKTDHSFIAVKFDIPQDLERLASSLNVISNNDISQITTNPETFEIAFRIENNTLAALLQSCVNASGEVNLCQQIFNLGKQQKAFFVQSLWQNLNGSDLSDEGLINQKKNTIFVSFNRKSMADDVQLLLQSVGINSQLKVINTSNTRDYNISIHSADMKQKMIDFVHLSNSELNLYSRSAISNETEFEMLSHSVELKENEEDSGYMFQDKILKIEEQGMEDVYDLSVPGYENWLANGIISHNSGAIEQDADLIVFVYRDEVYNEDSPEKGIAEVIIGKQRNGPLGTVRLTFLGQFTRFENYTEDPYFNEDY